MSTDNPLRQTVCPMSSVKKFHYQLWRHKKIFGVATNHFTALILVSVLFGCASGGGKFSSTVEANIGVFADNTIAMLRDAKLGFERDKTIYVREFVNMQGAEEQRLISVRHKLDDLFRDIIYYSLQLVAIAEAHDNEADRVAAYVDLLKPESTDDRVLEALGLDKVSYLEILEDVAKRERFLDALRSAQPILNGIARHADSNIADLGEAADDVVSVLGVRIDTAYEDVVCSFS